MKHKVSIKVGHVPVVESKHMRIPKKLISFFCGDYTDVLMLKPGETVEAVEITEVAEHETV